MQAPTGQARKEKEQTGKRLTAKHAKHAKLKEKEEQKRTRKEKNKRLPRRYAPRNDKTGKINRPDTMQAATGDPE